MPQITAWSPSRFNDYQKCPRLFKYKYIDKLQLGQDKESFVRGRKVDDDIQNYICGWSPELKYKVHENIQPWIDWLREGYKQGLVKTQYELAFDYNWKQVDWRSKDVWFRIKIDAYLEGMVVIDWKSGQFQHSEEHGIQMNLYAIAILSLHTFPPITELRTYLMFTKSGEILTTIYDNAFLLESSREKWYELVQPLFEDQEFKTKPGQYCRWCDFSKNRGGPCEY